MSPGGIVDRKYVARNGALLRHGAAAIRLQATQSNALRAPSIGEEILALAMSTGARASLRNQPTREIVTR